MVTGLHARVYRRTGGKIGGKIGKAPVLVLHTTGRKTGKERLTPLLCLEDGGDLIVVASNGGDDRMPAWYGNLKAHPAVRVDVGAERRDCTARTATLDEKERLWPRLVQMYAGYEKHQAKTEREIPLVVLTPTG